MIDLLGQTTTADDVGVSVAIWIVGLIIQVALAIVAATIASRKGYSWGLFFVFGLLCWLPAIITAALLSDKTAQAQYSGRVSYGGSTWQPQQPAGPPPGWYPDPQQDGRQRYWDGTRWTEHTSP